MGIRRFEDLVVWQRARCLAGEVYRVTGSGAFARDRALQDQIRRSAVSVVSNIAEGFDRYGATEFRRYLVVARGSAGELRAQLYLGHDLGYLPPEDFHALQSAAVEVSRLLIRLHASLAPPSGQRRDTGLDSGA